MRIEVLEGSGDPVIYPFNSSKLVVGSGEHCDIVLSASGISRKHIIILNEDEKFYVIDQGSTNGSFLNEERLIPGRKVEFTSFFPVRLGEDTLISLLSDEEGSELDFSIPVPKAEKSSPAIQVPQERDATTVISLKNLQNVKTENLVLERNRKREIRKKAAPAKKVPQKKKEKPNYVAILSILIVALAAYYNFFLMAPETSEEVREVGQLIQTETPNAAENAKAVPVVNTDLISDSDIPTKEYVSKLLNNLKCTIDVEIYLCDLIPGLRNDKFGVTQVGLTVYVLVDGSQYFHEARMRVKNAENKELVRQTAAYLFLMRMPELDQALLKDSRLIIGLFNYQNNEPVADTLIAIKPEVFNREKASLNEDNLKHLKAVGENVFEHSKKIYKVL